MHYLSTMDVFLGSHSNVYPVVAGRRIAMWHHAPTATTAPYPHSNSSHNPSHNPSPNPNPSDGASDAGGGAGAGAGPAWHFRVTGTNASTSAGTLSQVPLIQRRNCALLSTPTRLAYVPPAIHCEGTGFHIARGCCEPGCYIQHASRLSIAAGVDVSSAESRTGMGYECSFVLLHVSQEDPFSTVFPRPAVSLRTGLTLSLFVSPLCLSNSAGSAEVRGLWHIHSKFGYNTDNPSLMEAVAALAPSPDPAP